MKNKYAKCSSRCRSYKIFGIRFTKSSYFPIQVLFSFFGESIRLNYRRKSSRGWDIGLILKQHERLLRETHTLFVGDHSWVFPRKREVVKFLNIRHFFKVASKERHPIVNRHNHSTATTTLGKSSCQSRVNFLKLIACLFEASHMEL